MKHRFSGEQSTEGDTVNSANQLFIMPAFNAMGRALEVEAEIGLPKGPADPGALSFRPARRGTFGHNGLESLIHRQAKAGPTWIEFAPQHPAETPGEVELAKSK